MQTHTERRTGSDRRLFEAATEQLSWNEAGPALMAAASDEPYDPYDPYWEPLKGQDDD